MTLRLAARELPLWVMLVAIFVVGQPSAAAALSFSQKPSAKRVEGGFEIRFALSESGDVEFAVLDAAGHVVRHLAAGVVGGKTAPPPPLAAKLVHTLLWDGLDDDGNTACGGPVQFR